MTFKGGKYVQNRRLLQHRRLNGLHVDLGNRAGSNQSVKAVVLVGDRDHRQVRIFHHQVPGIAHRNARCNPWRRVVFHVPHLRAHRGNLHRWFKPEPVQQKLGFIVQMPQSHRDIIVLPQHMLQRSIGDRRHDGIRVRIPVPADIGHHEAFLLPFSRPFNLLRCRIPQGQVSPAHDLSGFCQSTCSFRLGNSVPRACVMLLQCGSRPDSSAANARCPRTSRRCRTALPSQARPLPCPGRNSIPQCPPPAAV